MLPPGNRIGNWATASSFHFLRECFWGSSFFCNADLPVESWRKTQKPFLFCLFCFYAIFSWHSQRGAPMPPAICWKVHPTGSYPACPMPVIFFHLPFVSLSLSSTRTKASGARACPALTRSDRFIRVVPESALRAYKSRRSITQVKTFS